MAARKTRKPDFPRILWWCDVFPGPEMAVRGPWRHNSLLNVSPMRLSGTIGAFCEYEENQCFVLPRVMRLLGHSECRLNWFDLWQK